MKRIDVAIAVVSRQDQVLICKRTQAGHLGGFWEFPGGKVEAGDSIEQCVARDLQEELAIEADVLAAFRVIEHDYPDRLVRLHPFLCAHRRGEPQPIGCEQARWVGFSELGSFTFPPANDELIGLVIQHFSD
jgi:mutator protein MutT